MSKVERNKFRAEEIRKVVSLHIDIGQIFELGDLERMEPEDVKKIRLKLEDVNNLIKTIPRK